MSLSFCVLGSGSAGNSTLVICGDGDQRRCLLIDAGLSPRMTAKRLAPLGFALQDICEILITHFDTDHFYQGWLKVIDRQGIRVHVHRRHRSAAWRCGLTARQAMLYTECVTLECGPHAKAMLLAHDDLGSVGFVLENNSLRLGYATDLGRVPESLLDHFELLDALAIESNYDRHMQLASGRPYFLKRRIMGGNGHLSNDQSLEAVQQVADRSALSHIALLHLSRECNDPAVVRNLYEQDAPDLVQQLTITCQHAASPVLEVRRVPKQPRPSWINPTVRRANGLSKQLPLFVE